MPTILIGTQAGLLSFDASSGERQTQLEGRQVQALAPAGWKRIWAVLETQEIWHADGSGFATWTRAATLADLPGEPLHARCLADTRANDTEGILIGTSGARLFRIASGLERVTSFDAAPGRDHWYTPWGGPPDVRSITEDDRSVFVNVHVGGVLRSRDQGATWQPTIDLHADVHRVVTGAGRIYAAGAGGLSVSADGGDTWRTSARGLHAAYCRSVTVCGDSLLVSASEGPGGGGRAALYRSALDGTSFERCRGGLPDWFEGNIDSLCLDALPDGGLAAFGSEGGELFVSTDHGSTWTPLADGLPTIHCVLVLP